MDNESQDLVILAGDGEGELDIKRLEEMVSAALDQFGFSLARTRGKAIAGRMRSGIEDVWAEDEEFYQGIDDANRGEQKATWRQKPAGQVPPSTQMSQFRSTVFPNITRPYVDAAAARIADMLLPTDDRAWAIKPTPMPEIEDLAQGKIPESTELYAQQAFGPEAAPGARDEYMIGAQADARKILDDAKTKAEKAQMKIEDWHTEGNFHSHVRSVIEDAARIGTGVLKGPFPQEKRKFIFMGEGLQEVSKIIPGSKQVDPWNLFPDPACGESVHNGSYIWERDFITAKQLMLMSAGPEYLPHQISKVLAEGPMKAEVDPKPVPEGEYQPQAGDDRFEIWYYYGMAEREDIEAMGCDCGDEPTEGEMPQYVPVRVEMVNNHVIKIAMNPLDTGDFPYDVMVWQRRSGHWAGTGVARHIRTPQRMVVAATRALMDNAGLAGGPMLVFRQGIVTPADNQYVIAPRKIWFIDQDADEMANANNAIGVVKVDMLVNELTAVINLALRFAEDVTGLPMLLQGQMGNKTPDTLGGMQMLNNNSSTVLRRLARLFDDRVTEPHVRRYYDFLLQYEEDASLKGDYCIDARGSSALVERDLQNQAIMQMGSIIVNPVFGKDPKKWMDEMLKAQRLDPKRFEYDDEQWQQIVENMSKPKPDSSVEVAQIRAQAQTQVAEVNAQAKQTAEEMKSQLTQALEQMRQQFNLQENNAERALKLVLANAERDGKMSITVEEIKAALADTAMKLRGQFILSDQKQAAEAMTPPTEPAGRAKPGRSFEQ